MIRLTVTIFDKRDEVTNKNEDFHNSTLQNVLTTINGMPHQLFAADLKARDKVPELKKCFYKKQANVAWEDFLTTKFGLRIDTCSSIDNTIHGSGRAMEKSDALI